MEKRGILEGIVAAAVRALLLAVATAGLAFPSAASGQDATEQLCFDVLVVARLTAQVPSPFPHSDDSDEIVMAWPWFLDLRIDRVVQGGPMPKRLRNVLAVLHTPYRTDRGERKWWLRRNSLGGYNLLRFAEDERPPRCGAGAPAASPYLGPKEGETLEDIRRRGARMYDG